jgi:rhodanese-related sulfurtransferase
MVIDLRNLKDYSQGHIVHSINNPAETITHNLSKLKTYQSKIVIFVCANGLTAKRWANELMRQQVIKDIRVLANGIQAWKEAGLPLEKK